MSTTLIADVTNQVQKYWAPVLTKQLRGSLLLGSLVDKSYQGDLKEMGDRVRVSQVNAPTGQLLTVGTDADSFSSEAISSSYIDITANKRAVASYKFESVVQLQSQLGWDNPDVRESMIYAMNNQINTYLYSLVAASTSSPDHNVSGVSDFNASQLSAARLLAATAKWRKDKGWYCIVDPSYMSDIQNATTLTSSDYGASDAPVISGNVAMQRFGFNIFEDNNMKSTAGAAVTDHALLFTPDFMHMVMQSEVQIKVSDLHPLGQFGVILSADVVFGAALGVDGAKKHIQVYNSAW
jgi:hypothetical protein